MIIIYTEENCSKGRNISLIYEDIFIYIDKN